MRLGRFLLWSTGVLVAAILAGCMLLVLFFPWERCEEKLKESLSARLPVQVDFEAIGLVFKGGPAISVKQVRLFAKGEQTRQEAILTANKLTLRPLLKDLLEREVAARFLVETPALHLSQDPEDRRSLGALLGILAPNIDRTQEVKQDDPPSGRPESLPELIPLPGGLALTSVTLAIQDGSVAVQQPGDGAAHAGSPVISGLRASLVLNRDLSFRYILSDCHLQWRQDVKGPLGLSGSLSGDINGRAVSIDDSRIQGRLRIRETVVMWRGRTVALAGPLQVSCSVEGTPDRRFAASELLLNGSGVEISMKGSTRLDEDPYEFVIHDLNANVRDWEPLRALLAPETAFSGELTLLAETLRINPTQPLLPYLPRGSLRPSPPPGLACDALLFHFTDGHIEWSDPKGHTASLDGMEIRLEQQDREWIGRVELARLEASKPRALPSGKRPERPQGELEAGKTPDGPGSQEPEKPKEPPGAIPENAEEARGDALRFSGPVSIHGKWAEGDSDAAAIVVLDLTGGRLALRDLLDKPADVPCQIGVRARILRDEMRLDRATLHLGDMRWNITGRVMDPAEPFLNAEVASNILSLEAVTGLSPALRKHGLRGEIEIKEVALTGKLRQIRQSAFLEARVVSKDLRLHETSINGLYVQAIYGNQKLTLDPVVIQPTRGMIEAELSADLSGASPNVGRHQYYGTVKISNADINELAALASPELEGEASGSGNVNLAFRGSGFAWPEAGTNLEAKARVSLDHVSLKGGDEQPWDATKRLGARFRQVLEVLAGKFPVEEAPTGEAKQLGPEEQRLLKANRAAGWFTIREGRLSTRNLVAIYEGKLIEIQGSIDMTGHLQVEQGKLFIGSRVFPFHLDCPVGKEPCTPSLDLTRMGKRAAAELSSRILLLSEGFAGVFQDLFL